MLEPVQTHALLKESAYLYAGSDPIAAARTLARGVRRQTPGSKIALARHLVEALEHDEPGITARIRDALSA